MTNIDINSDQLISLKTSSRGYELINLDLNNKEITNLDIIVLYSSYNLSINESLLNGYLNELDAIKFKGKIAIIKVCLLYTSPSPRDATLSRMPSSA